MTLDDQMPASWAEHLDRDRDERQAVADTYPALIQRRREDDRIAALSLTPKDMANLDAAVAQGWSERTWLLGLADERQSLADAARLVAEQMQDETEEGEAIRWRHKLAARKGEPEVLYPAEVGQFGRRLAGWD